MIYRTMLPILFAALLWGCDDTSTTAGTSSETTTGVQIFLPNGAPAASARVQIFAVGDTGSIPLSQSFTDSRGQLQVTAPKAGRYNLVIRGDSLSLLEDSLVSDGTSMSAWSDTLRTPGRVVGRVHVQAFDDPRITWVYLMGSGLYSNVDDSGKFSFSGVAPGRYTIAFLTTKDSVYTPTFRSAQVLPDSTLDLGTVDLVYTGLPLVTGLSASYDSGSGILNVHWSPCASKRVASYKVTGNSSSWTTSDTSFKIQCFSDSITFDSSSATWTLRVAAVDSSGNVGRTWSQVQVEATSPFLHAPVAISWAKASAFPLSSTTGSVSVDTLGGDLLVISRNSGTIQIARSSDASSWSTMSIPLADDKPFLVSGGKFLTLDPHVSDSNLLKPNSCREGGDSTPCSLYDSLRILSYESSSWKTWNTYAVGAFVNELTTVSAGDSFLVLQSKRYSPLPFMELRTVLVCQSSSCHESNSLKPILAPYSADIFAYTFAAGGSLWSLYNPYSGSSTTVNRLTSDVLASKLEASCSSLLATSNDVFVNGKVPVVSKIGSPLRWRRLVLPPTGVFPQGIWKGMFVSVSSAGIYFGTIK